MSPLVNIFLNFPFETSFFSVLSHLLSFPTRICFLCFEPIQIRHITMWNYWFCNMGLEILWKLAKWKIIANIYQVRSRKDQGRFLFLLYPSKVGEILPNLKIRFGFRESLQSALVLLNQFQNISTVINAGSLAYRFKPHFSDSAFFCHIENTEKSHIYILPLTRLVENNANVLLLHWMSPRWKFKNKIPSSLCFQRRLGWQVNQDFIWALHFSIHHITALLM